MKHRTNGTPNTEYTNTDIVGGCNTEHRHCQGSATRNTEHGKHNSGDPTLPTYQTSPNVAKGAGGAERPITTPAHGTRSWYPLMVRLQPEFVNSGTALGRHPRL